MNRIVVGLFLWAAALAVHAQALDKVGVGDALRVSVFQQPDLATEARVSERGTITMPLIGEVRVAGMSANEAAARIAAELKNGKYLNNPQVTVAVTTLRSRQVNVLGLVARPGRFALDDTSSQLADVIAAAGGISPEGSKIVTVIRDGTPQRVDLFTTAFDLKNGDTVLVDRAPVFYIYGEVARAGAYRIEPGMTVMQAIAAGGGITPRGSERRLVLRRPVGEGKYQESAVGLQHAVKPDDVIYVRESIF
ncbi:MAG TPA: polysaccharide export protein EpsE [Burkholderiales bacterium]|nr:polysaccharide export protein EpsE [Burkholderiales bacterium]